MTKDEFIAELDAQREYFLKEVYSYFENNQKERGNLAHDGWRDRFIKFLSDYTEKQAQNFKDTTRNLNFLVGGMYQPPGVEFMNDYGRKTLAFIDNLIDEINKGYVEVFSEKAQREAVAVTVPTIEHKEIGREIFIVHGHDNEAKETVARFLHILDLKPIILHEQANGGKTIIEKFEHHSEVGFAVVLLTPDDVGYAKGQEKDAKPRARQNVIFELGYFFGKLTRGKVCALYKEGVDLPSDFQGILYISMDAGGAWKYHLAKEMKVAGIDIDMNKI